MRVLSGHDSAADENIQIPVSVREKLVNRTPEQRAVEDDGRVYVVGEGDTLASIAVAELGSSRRWAEIYELNKGVIQDPERIHPGQRLVLPAE